MVGHARSVAGAWASESSPKGSLVRQEAPARASSHDVERELSDLFGDSAGLPAPSCTLCLVWRDVIVKLGVGQALLLGVALRWHQPFELAGMHGESLDVPVF
jgi:hypothetical protein